MGSPAQQTSEQSFPLPISKVESSGKNKTNSQIQNLYPVLSPFEFQNTEAMLVDVTQMKTVPQGDLTVLDRKENRVYMGEEKRLSEAS